MGVRFGQSHWFLPCASCRALWLCDHFAVTTYAGERKLHDKREGLGPRCPISGRPHKATTRRTTRPPALVGAPCAGGRGISGIGQGGKRRLRIVVAPTAIIHIFVWFAAAWHTSSRVPRPTSLSLVADQDVWVLLTARSSLRAGLGCLAARSKCVRACGTCCG